MRKRLLLDFYWLNFLHTAHHDLLCSKAVLLFNWATLEASVFIYCISKNLLNISSKMHLQLMYKMNFNWISAAHMISDWQYWDSNSFSSPPKPKLAPTVAFLLFSGLLGVIDYCVKIWLHTRPQAARFCFHPQPLQHVGITVLEALQRQAVCVQLHWDEETKQTNLSLTCILNFSPPLFNWCNHLHHFNFDLMSVKEPLRIIHIEIQLTGLCLIFYELQLLFSLQSPKALWKIKQINDYAIICNLK